MPRRRETVNKCLRRVGRCYGSSATLELDDAITLENHGFYAGPRALPPDPKKRSDRQRPQHMKNRLLQLQQKTEAIGSSRRSGCGSSSSASTQKQRTKSQRQQMQKRQLLQLQSLWLQRRLLVKMPPRLQLALSCRRQKEQINSDGQLRGGPHSHPDRQQLGGGPQPQPQPHLLLLQRRRRPRPCPTQRLCAIARHGKRCPAV